MTYQRWFHLLGIPAVQLISLLWLNGCDSGQRAIDEVTGNRAVKQYHKSKQNIQDIADRQDKRFRNVQDNDTEDDRQ